VRHRPAYFNGERRPGGCAGPTGISRLTKALSSGRRAISAPASSPPWTISIGSPSFTPGPSSSIRLLDIIRISETLI
jgi:hypothetical protein